MLKSYFNAFNEPSGPERGIRHVRKHVITTRLRRSIRSNNEHTCRSNAFQKLTVLCRIRNDDDQVFKSVYYARITRVILFSISVPFKRDKRTIFNFRHNIFNRTFHRFIVEPRAVIIRTHVYENVRNRATLFICTKLPAEPQKPTRIEL